MKQTYLLNNKPFFTQEPLNALKVSGYVKLSPKLRCALLNLHEDHAMRLHPTSNTSVLIALKTGIFYQGSVQNDN